MGTLGFRLIADMLSSMGSMEAGSRVEAEEAAACLCEVLQSMMWSPQGSLENHKQAGAQVTPDRALLRALRGPAEQKQPTGTCACHLQPASDACGRGSLQCS